MNLMYDPNDPVSANYTLLYNRVNNLIHKYKKLESMYQKRDEAFSILNLIIDDLEDILNS